MALEDLTGTNKYITNLVNTNPLSADDRREGDDHIRGIKNVLLNTFPGISAPVDLAELPTYVKKAGDFMTGGREYLACVRQCHLAAHEAGRGGCRGEFVFSGGGAAAIQADARFGRRDGGQCG